jgi:hypothetical protein
MGGQRNGSEFSVFSFQWLAFWEGRGMSGQGNGRGEQSRL